MFLKTSSTNSKTITLLIDTEFEEEFSTTPAKTYGSLWLNITWIENIISIYERRGKNVAANLATLLHHYNIKKGNEGRHETYRKHSPLYAKYADDVERLLLLV
jgi:hypothetical protein